MAKLLDRPFTFQSTFPRGERRRLFDFMVVFDGVSIHVPTRGTTFVINTFIVFLLCFNPRSHEGNDRSQKEIAQMQIVSIHVPTRGTTQCLAASSQLYAMFQSTFPRGERPWRAEHGADRVPVSIHVPTRGTTSRKG